MSSIPTVFQPKNDRIEFEFTDSVLGGLRSAHLEFSAPSGVLFGKVRDISDTGLRVEFEADGEFRLGQVIEDLSLGLGVERFNLQRMVVRWIAALDEGGFGLGLEAENNDTRASLWTACHLLKSMTELDLVADNEGPAPSVPERGHYTEIARQARLKFIREFSGEALESIEEVGLDASRLTSNIENFVGCLEIPVGLAGPLRFHGEHTRGVYYAPMATTEGALVASATRGATALTRSGGVKTRVLRQRMLRVPVFIFETAEGAAMFRQWVGDQFDGIVAQTKLVSNHAKLVEARPDQVGTQVAVTFAYETGDAAGQNMTTSCTWKACQWIISQLEHFPRMRCERFFIEDNRSGDKKVNFNSFINGRGIRVTAEATLPADIVRTVLKVEPEQLLQSFRKFLHGSTSIGMVGFNINIANVLGAIFTATGQDIACVHESSIGILQIEPAEEGGLYVSMDLPALIVGSVGGGTNLPNQADYLRMIHCKGVHKSKRLAEIIAGFALALDLSTLSAIASGQFASAHDKLGRNRPVDWFTQKDVNAAFFEAGLKDYFSDDKLAVDDVSDVEIAMGSSIITELSAQKAQKKFVGFMPRTVSYTKGDGTKESLDTVVKVKPLDTEVILMTNSMAQMCGGAVGQYHQKYKDKVGFQNCHEREVSVYAQKDPRFTNHMPKIYHTVADSKREAYVVVMEKLSGLEKMNSVEDVSSWDEEHFDAAIRGLAQFQSVWLGKEKELKEQSWLGYTLNAEDMIEMEPLWTALANHAAEEFPEWFTQEDLNKLIDLIRRLPDWRSDADTMPMTLCHNDFNPRNLGFRREDGVLKLCAYDWELATLNLPQRDLAEFLTFTLPEDVSLERVERYIELHRSELEAASGVKLDPATYRRGFRYGLNDFTVNRLNLYLMAHTFRSYRFLERVVRTSRHLHTLTIDY